MTPRNVRRIAKASEARRAQIATSGTETGLGATWTGYPHPARGGDIPGAQTGDFDCCVRDVDREVAHAVAAEREAIAGWHEVRSSAFAERARGRFGDAKFARSVMATHDASARAIRSGAHNEGAR